LTLQTFTPPDGGTLTLVEHDGRPAFIARQLGALLGYGIDGARLVKSIRHDWRDELVEGVDYVIVDGEALDEVKASLGTATVPSRAPSLMLLTESGLYAALLLTRKPAGRALRRWLRDEVMPQIARSGDYDSTKTVTDDGLVEGQVAQLESGSLAQRLAARKDAIRELKRSGAPPEFCLHLALRNLEEATGESTSHYQAVAWTPPPSWHSPSTIAFNLSRKWDRVVTEQTVGRAITALGLRQRDPRSAWPVLVKPRHNPRNPNGSPRQHVTGWRYSPDACKRIAERVRADLEVSA